MSALPDPSVRFAVLGPVRAWRDGADLDLGSPQQRAVLATLLLRRGRPVTLSELVDAVWGEAPPVAAVSVLRTYASRLRKVLESPRGERAAPRVIVSDADGYNVRVAGDAFDLDVFERQVAAARTLRAAGDVAEAADLLGTALDLWQGVPLAGLPGPLAAAERARLDEERLAALETRLECDLELGRHGRLSAELLALTAEHPLRERLWQMLMLTLYRSGRQAEALATYRRGRAALVAELGIEPSAPLRELHERILTADPSLDPGPPQSTARPADPPAAQLARPAQLPADLPAFTGRGYELEQIRGLAHAAAERPSTVVVTAIGGMAGVGKTALAVHWAHEIAHRFPDGQLYVNLRGFDPTGSVLPPAEAVRLFLDALGVPPQRIPAGLDAQAALYRSLLAVRRMLIVIDNARDTEQVRPLLPGAAGCLVIVTSRNQLTSLIANGGAYLLTLDALTPAESHGFLVRRLGAARLAAEPEAAEEIITSCARLPLALAIVAARAVTHPAFSLQGIADELRASHGSLDAFTTGELTTDVRAVFSWSHDALSAPAARLFRLLGLRSGGDVSAPAAAALAGLPLRDARRLLGELTRASLLTEQQPGRYTLHDLLHIHATERAHTDETPQECGQAVERLLAWYLHTTGAAIQFLAPHLRPVSLDPPPPGCVPLSFKTYDQALVWCETERVNLVAAVHQAATAGQFGIAWRFPLLLWGFLYLRSHLNDWLDTSRTGLTAARSAHDRTAEAWNLGTLAAALANLRRLEEAIEHQKRSISIWRELRDIKGLAMTLGNLGSSYVDIGQPGKALDYLRRGLALHRIDRNVWGEGLALNNLGETYQLLGRFEEAMDCMEQALAIHRTQGNRWMEGHVFDGLGTIHHGLHRYDDAIRNFHEALATHLEVGNRWGEALTLGKLGDVHLAAGDRDAARTSWQRALAVHEESDHPDAEPIRAKLRDLGA